MIFGVRAEAENTAAGTRPLEVAGVDACLTDRPPAYMPSGSAALITGGLINTPRA